MLHKYAKSRYIHYQNIESVNCIDELFKFYSRMTIKNNFYLNKEMTAHYPLFDDEVKEGPPGMPGIGFKLANDGNYDMEGKILKNVSDPEVLTDCATKKYTDQLKEDLANNSLMSNDEYFDAKRKIIRYQGDPEESFDSATKKYVDDTVEQLKSICLINDSGNYNAKGKNIVNTKDPENSMHAVNKQYFENNALILKGESYDAKNYIISNVSVPKTENDVVTKKHLDYFCIKWDTTDKSYFAHNERIGSVKKPQKDTDCANKYYIDMKTFCATTDSGVEFTGTGYKTFQFNKTTSKLLDKNLKLSQDMYMKISIYLACDRMNENSKIRLEKVKQVLLDRAINVNEETITMFTYGRSKEVLTLSVLTGGKCKLRPYLHIEKLEF